MRIHHASTHMSRRLAVAVTAVLSALQFGAAWAAAGDADAASPVPALPDAPLWRQPLDIRADGAAPADLLAQVRRQYRLPLALAGSLKKDPSLPLLTLRMRGAAPEMLLGAVAVGLGEGCRWRMIGEEMVLERRRAEPPAPPEGTQPALPPSVANALTDVLAGAGLVGSAPGEVAPAFREAAAINVTPAARQLAALLAATLPAGALAENNPAGGVLVNTLPPALQQEAYRIAIGGSVRTTLGSAASAGGRLAGLANSLAGGKEPAIRLRRQPDGTWGVDYDTGFGTPTPQGMRRNTGAARLGVF